MVLAIVALPATGVIVALVEGAKRLGVPARWAPLLAVVLGLAYGVLVHVAVVAPSAGGWLDTASGGIVLGLTAAGLYSGAKAVIAGGNSRGTNSA